MYAVIKTGGKQYKVSQGDVIDVELLGLETGNTVQFEEVLLMFDGNEHKIGEPSLEGVTVLGEILGESAGPKVKSFKYKPRKRQNRRFGHRQHYSRVKILEIGGVKAEKPKAAAKTKEAGEAKPKTAAKPKAEAEAKPKAKAAAAKPKTAKPKAAAEKKEAPRTKKSAPKKKKSEEGEA